MRVVPYLLLAVIPVLTSPLPDPDEHCRCVPDQWGGILSSTDREFDLKGGQSGHSENNLRVHYDFFNKRFAMTDLRTGNSAIADYVKGYKYVIRGGICHGIHTGEEMRQMCLPESADFLGEFKLGTSVPVDLWEFVGPFNTSMKTAVLHHDCIPVSEEIYMARGSYVSITSSVYLDVTLGLEDPTVFLPPADCVLQPAGRSRGPNLKRSADKHETLGLLRSVTQRLGRLD